MVSTVGVKRAVRVILLQSDLKACYTLLCTIFAYVGVIMSDCKESRTTRAREAIHYVLPGFEVIKSSRHS